MFWFVSFEKKDKPPTLWGCLLCGGYQPPYNKLTSVFHASVLLLIMNFYVAVDRRVDPHTTVKQCHDEEVHCQ